MAWREAIAQAQARDIERRRMNPGVQALGFLVQNALSNKMQIAQEQRTEAAGARNAARSAVYSRYPDVAAKEAGINIPEGAGTPTPSGLEPYQVTYDEQGNAQTVYRAPETLTEADLAKMYSQFITQIRQANAQNSVIPNYKPIPVPTFTEWKTEHFPEFAGGGVVTTGGTMTEDQAAEWLRQNGAPVTAANVQAVIKKFGQ